jgi:tripeptidyl-peptidase I
MLDRNAYVFCSFPQRLQRAPLAAIPLPKNAAPVANLSSSAIPASCSSTITPACVQALYNVPTTKATQSSNQLGVSGFLDQFANQADLKVRISTHH